MLRYFHAKRSEMAQFVTSLQYYIVFEVLEPAWASFMKQLGQAQDLDAVIALHDGTLEAITKVGPRVGWMCGYDGWSGRLSCLTSSHCGRPCALFWNSATILVAWQPPWTGWMCLYVVQMAPLLVSWTI